MTSHPEVTALLRTIEETATTELQTPDQSYSQFVYIAPLDGDLVLDIDSSASEWRRDGAVKKDSVNKFNDR